MRPFFGGMRSELDELIRLGENLMHQFPNDLYLRLAVEDLKQHREEVSSDVAQ